jgi:hypothetical protein
MKNEKLSPHKQNPMYPTTYTISHISALGVLSTAKYNFVYARVDITVWV